MFKVGSVILAAAAITIVSMAFGFGLFSSPEQPETAFGASVYDFKMKDIDGKNVNLKKYKGKVVMIVNTASKCGYTPQYEGLEAIYKKYKDQDFVVLGFPANNFRGQEPGTDKEIKEFCTLKYDVTFPMFSKISVKGEDQHPLYKFLTEKETNPQFAGDITWNFNKFLIGKDGKVVARYETKIKPDDATVTAEIEKLIADK
jgi:glutathione peroxidase